MAALNRRLADLANTFMVKTSEILKKLESLGSREGGGFSMPI